MEVHNSLPNAKLLPVSLVMRCLKQRGYPAGRAYIYKLIDMGEIKSIRIGRRKGIRVREDWLNQYMLEKENEL